MNKIKLIADISKRQQSYWDQVNALYNEALEKNYKARKDFDMKVVPYQSSLPAEDWLEISRLIESIKSLEDLKDFVKAQKRGAKEDTDSNDEEVSLPEVAEVINDIGSLATSKVESKPLQGFIKFGDVEPVETTLEFPAAKLTEDITI